MRYLVLVLLPFLFTNCENEDPALFQMEYTQDFEITAGLNIFETHHFLLQNIPTNFDNYLTTFGVQSGDVKEIAPRSARLSTLFSGATYDIVEEISVRIYDNDPSNFSEIFYADNIPFNEDEVLDLIPTLVNAQERMMQGTFNIDVAIRFRQIPAQFIESRLIFDFSVR